MLACYITFNSESNSYRTELRVFAIMVDTIEEALNPFYLVACFFGIGVVRHSLDHLKLCFNIFYILIMYSIYVCGFYFIINFFVSNRIFIGYLVILIVTTNLLVAIMSVIITICNRKKCLMCIRNLSLVDNTLEQLGIPKEYCKIRNSAKWTLIAWFITIYIMWILDSFRAIIKFRDIRAAIIPIILQYPYHLNNFMNIIFIFFLSYIGTRLNKINNCIEHLSETKQYGLTCIWKKCLATRCYVQSAENCEHVLWTAMHLYLDLCRIARNINDFYGMQITLQIIFYFIFLTGQLYILYRKALCLKHNRASAIIEISNLLAIIRSSIWSIIFLIQVVILNYTCENVGAKTEKTKSMIYKMTNLSYFNHIRQDIYQFVLQISLQPLKFNGMGLFYFGYKFLFKFIVGIVSLEIFMMQMDTSPLSQFLIFNLNNRTCEKNM